MSVWKCGQPWNLLVVRELPLGLMSGAARAAELARAGRITVAGDPRALDDLPALFAMSLAPNPPSE